MAMEPFAGCAVARSAIARHAMTSSRSTAAILRGRLCADPARLQGRADLALHYKPTYQGSALAAPGTRLEAGWNIPTPYRNTTAQLGRRRSRTGRPVEVCSDFASQIPAARFGCNRAAKRV